MMLAPEYLALRDLDPGLWGVVDDFSMDGPGPYDAMASFFVRECLLGEDCGCALWDGTPGGPGAFCHYDCQCEWPLSCLYEGMMPNPPEGTCARTCSVDADCAPTEHCQTAGLEDAPEGICLAVHDHECGDVPGGCPAGWACEWRGGNDAGTYLCVPAMASGAIGMPCGTDCDCPAGYSCTEHDDTGQRTCQIKCRGNGDCPDTSECDEPGSWSMNQQVCGWLPAE